jgi:hypothetical protein
MLMQAEFVHYLVNEWGYPGISAVLAEDADVLLPIVDVYALGQADTGTAVVSPKPKDEPSWAPAEVVSADDLTREEILNGAFGPVPTPS